MAKEYNIMEKFMLVFIVMTNVKIVREFDKNLDAEALRVVSSLPKYKPGKLKGKPELG